ncbi:MAG: hypothetical protein IJD63_01940 [Oscillospiraceae bacterium]|nr:hypothetical protein [Oscillospiraceae bacterium]
MNCLNCNRETTGKAFFCEQCQQEMEGYPVPKGTPVVIPVQPSPVSPKKQSKHLFGSMEDQYLLSKRTARRLAFAFSITLLLLILAIGALVYLWMFGMPDNIPKAPKLW